MQNLVSFREADAEVEFGVQPIFREQHILKEWGRSKTREETPTLGTGLIIPLPTWRGSYRVTSIVRGARFGLIWLSLLLSPWV